MFLDGVVCVKASKLLKSLTKIFYVKNVIHLPILTRFLIKTKNRKK